MNLAHQIQWRAVFDVIDFMPLVTVDYSGGMIITDWYTDANTTEVIKIHNKIFIKRSKI